ncbi:MAG TPA: DoxX family protein [Candidatus Nanoarchaeia archaeon]|nr:DoxX family protein [Candidatus Nanoarchaeia archaeon]
MFKKFVKKNSEYFYFVFRILIGLMFFLHGFAKVQSGVFSGPSILMVAASSIELVVGLLILLGLFIRYAAFVGAIEMVVAYFMAHSPNGLSPLANRGEAAVLFFAAFLVLIAYGAKKWALDNLFKK